MLSQKFPLESDYVYELVSCLNNLGNLLRRLTLQREIQSNQRINLGLPCPLVGGIQIKSFQVDGIIRRSNDLQAKAAQTCRHGSEVLHAGRRVGLNAG